MKNLQKKHLNAQRIICLLFVAMMVVTMVGVHRSPVAAQLSLGRKTPILLFGIDAADASQHTDTLMVSALDPLYHALNILSIPRDTRIRLPGYRFRRVNEIYGYHVRKTKDRGKSAKEVVAGVEYILSSDETKVRIPYFIQVDYNGFRRIVDIMGGVWIRVRQPMHYDDHAGGYHFHKDPGRYLMSGKEALNYVRFRGPTGDRGRILRQQEFLRNMAKRLASPLLVLRFPKLVAAVASMVRTNLSLWDLVHLTLSARRLRPSSIRFYILPGRPRGLYWYMRKKQAQALAANLIMGVVTSYEPVPSIVPQEGTITVKVLNASGKRGMARELTIFLRSRGYDVVDWGNYAVQQIPTRVIDRKGKIKNAQAVANDLGVESYHSESNTRALVDVEVIIGQNYRGLGTLGK